MCFSSRKTPACIVGFLSILGIVAGILMIYFAAKLRNSEFLDKVQEIDEVESQVDIKAYRDIVFIVLLLFSLVAIVAAVMGIGSCKIKNRCYTCCYGILLLPTWITVMTMGGISVFLSYAAEDAVQEQCESYVSKFEVGIDGLSDKLNELKDAEDKAKAAGVNDNPLFADKCAKNYDSDIPLSIEIYDKLLINQEMCSINCPCKPISKRNQWTDMSQEELEKIDRCRDWDFSGTITTYKECLVTPGPNAKVRFQGFAEGIVDSDSWDSLADFIEFFEIQLDCAGVCKPAIFSFAQSIEDGKPNKSCVLGLMDSISDEFVGLSIATFVSGILLFFIFFFNYCLWKKY